MNSFRSEKQKKNGNVKSWTTKQKDTLHQTKMWNFVWSKNGVGFLKTIVGGRTRKESEKKKNQRTRELRGISTRRLHMRKLIFSRYDCEWSASSYLGADCSSNFAIFIRHHRFFSTQTCSHLSKLRHEKFSFRTTLSEIRWIKLIRMNDLREIFPPVFWTITMVIINYQTVSDTTWICAF